MGVHDFGLEKLGSFVQGITTPYPSTMAFGNGSSAFDATDTHLENEFTRKAVSWAWNGRDPRGTVLFGNTEAVGSSFLEMGLGSGVTANGSNIWSRDLSAIGSKLDSYALEISFDFRFRRI